MTDDLENCPAQYRRRLPSYDPRAEKHFPWLIVAISIAAVIAVGVWLCGRLG
jgi:hypothetical protein